MADDSNIDEILKSIDALLKEGEAQDHSHRGRDKPRSDAANSEESVHKDNENAVEMADSNEIASEPPVEQPADDEQTGAGTTEDAEPVDRLQEARAESGEADSLSEAPGEDAGGEKPRRIVLSEAMLVEVTPDLLDFAEQHTGEAEQEVPDASPGDEPETSEEVQVMHGDDQAEPQGASKIDAEQLVEQISNEITARLQDKLPRLVAKAIRKHLAAQLEKTDQNAH